MIFRIPEGFDLEAIAEALHERQAFQDTDLEIDVSQRLISFTGDVPDEFHEVTIQELRGYK